MTKNEQVAAWYLRRLEQAWETTAPMRERLKALAAGATYDGASDDPLFERAYDLINALADPVGKWDSEDD